MRCAPDLIPCPATFDAVSCDRPTGAHVHLAAGEMWARTAAAAGLTITVARGVAWVTQSGDGADHVLHGGEQFHGRAGAKVVVQAMDACAFAWA